MALFFAWRFIYVVVPKAKRTSSQHHSPRLGTKATVRLVVLFIFTTNESACIGQNLSIPADPGSGVAAKEQERLAAEQRENERREAERERERLEAECLKKRRLEAENFERLNSYERLAVLHREKERLEAEQREKERLEKDRLEADQRWRKAEPVGGQTAKEGRRCAESGGSK